MAGRAVARPFVMLVGVAVFCLMGVGVAPRAQAASVWEVNTTVDTTKCDALFCGLRGAVLKANASTGGDLIVLEGGYYKLTITGEDDTANKGDLDITDSRIVIAGPGVIDADGIDHVFEVLGGAELELRDVTVTGGNAFHANPLSGHNSGGGIHSRAASTVRVIDSIIVGNTAVREGGGIFNGGTMTVIDSAITDNTAGIRGGGILNWGTLRLIGSSLTTNSAPEGGGIYNFDGVAQTEAIDSMISGNLNQGSGNGPDCWGTLGTLGVVVVGDASDCTVTPVRVDHTTGESGGVEVVARLESDINPQLIFENSSTGEEWFHAMTSDGEFKISYNGSGGVEAKFFESGDLQLRRDIHAVNGYFSGDVYAQAVHTSSDGAAKTRVGPVDTAGVLDAVEDLELTRWRFTDDPGGVHVGPTAQDFAQGFGVGKDPTVIASVDADGVALAAIQALADENTALSGDIRMLQLGVAVLGLVVLAASAAALRKQRRTRVNARRTGARVSVVVLVVAAYATVGVAGAPPAEALDVWEVTTTADTTTCNASVCGLRGAVIAANASAGDDLIVLKGGYYQITSHLDITDSRIIIAGPGVIDANGSHRVFAVVGGLELRDLTVTGGFTASEGGGIYNLNTVRVIDSIISGNFADTGGGIYNEGTVTLIDTVVIDNVALLGGGIYNKAGSVRVVESTIIDNSAEDGGGVYNFIGPVTAVDSTIAGNAARVNGPDCRGTLGTLGVVVVGDASDCTVTPVRVDHTTGESGGVEVVARLESDINPQLIFENSSTGEEWFHAMTSDGEFKISYNGSGGVEAKFFESGDLQLRRDIHAVNGYFSGDVYAQAVHTSSDGAAKTRVGPVDTAGVLDAVEDLELTRWRFTDDPGGVHVGPTAQDFAQGFGVGKDPTVIASVDADGVALAAIQALADENTALSSRILVFQLILISLGVIVAIGGGAIAARMWQNRRAQTSRTGARVSVVVLVVAAYATVGVAGAPPAEAVDVWEVTTTFDTTTCNATFCSLRGAVIAANASAGDDLIVLKGGHYKLTILGTDNNAATGDLDITNGRITIAGPGVIDADGIDRVFHVIPTTGGGGSVELELRDITVTGGTVPSPYVGGGIYNAGMLRLIDSLITGNTAHGGGGIFNVGNLTLINTVVSDNIAGDDGGGIYNQDTLDLIDSTITGNASSGLGGGAFLQWGTSTAVSSTISGNSAATGSPDCWGTLIARGVVVVGDATDCTVTPVHVDHVTGQADGVEIVARLESDINPQLIFENSSTGEEWFHAMTADGFFKISYNGTGAIEARFEPDGDLKLRGDLYAVDAHLSGDLYAKAVHTSSDGAVKTRVGPVDAAGVLAAVEGLELTRWRFTDDPGGVHVGPTAQDFSAAFGMGEDPTVIASVDADGVALAAIQALAEENAGLANDLLTLQLALILIGLVGLVSGSTVSLRKRRSRRAAKSMLSDAAISSGWTVEPEGAS